METDRVKAFITVKDRELERLSVVEFPDEFFYNIDGVPTIIDSVRKNIAHCRVISYPASKLISCYVVKYEDCFAHGDNLKQAFLDAQHKAFDCHTRAERINEFIDRFPDPETKVDNTDLFKLHNWLTGSCEFGRRLFVTKFGLTDGQSSIWDFIRLSKGNFGSDIIEKLEELYLRKLSPA